MNGWRGTSFCQGLNWASPPPVASAEGVVFVAVLVADQPPLLRVKPQQLL